MMMIRYSLPVEPSTIFQSFVGEKGEGGAVAAGSMLPPSTGSCMLAPSEKGHLAATFSTAAGWCAGEDHPGAAASVNSKTADTFVSLRELHNPRSIGACREERDCGSSDQIGWATMFHSSGAPPPPGGPQQPLQQHKSSADVVSSVHMGRLMNTRVRHASAATTAPGVAPAVSLAQGSAHENGAKQFSGPYNRTGHLPHDIHSRKRRQGGNANGGGDAESEGAVAGGHGAGDQSARAYTQVRQPLKHGRGGSRTRFDSLGDGRDARGREAGERQAGPGGPVGLPAHPPNCADSFPLWGGPGISCQTQSSPPPPPEDTSAGAQQAPADSSSCRQVIRPSSSGTNSQSSGAERGGRNWRGLSPGRGAPPPPPPHAMKAVLRACYSDQIIDNSRGLPCFKRLKAAFVSVAEVAGHPDLIVPRYLNLARRLPPGPFQHPRLHQSVPLPPPAAPGGAAPAGAAAEDRRGSPAPQGEQAGLHSRDAHVGKTTAASGLGSSSSRSGAGASTGVPGTWSAQAVAGGRSCPSADSVSSHISIGSGETKQPPWLNRNADPGRQIMQEEMSEVSSVDSDDDEMEDGEVAEEAARVQTRQQQHVGVKDSRVSRTDATSPGDGSAPTAPARVPPWVSTTAAGVVHGLRSSSQQQPVYPRAFPSQADGQIPAEQQSTSVPDVREAHQHKSADTLSFQCGLPTVPHGSSSSSKRAKQYPSETPGATACPADGETPSGRTFVQHFPSASELTSGQLSSHTSVVVETPEDRPYSGLSGIVTVSGGSSGLQNVRTTSSCSATAQQPEASTGAALLQPPAASHAGVAPSRGCSAVAHSGSHVLQPPGEAGEAHVETGGSCMHQDNCYRPKTCITAGNSSAGAAAKPRPVDPRLTRQPKLQAGHQGRSTGGGTLQEGRSAAVSAPADTVDMTASSVGTAEPSVERKNQPDPAASSVQPATAVALTSVCSSSGSSSSTSSSSGSKSDSASAASTAEAQTQPTRYYVCSIDGSRVELKPPQAPAPGTLPESLAGTCIARGKLPLLLDLDNTLLHAQAAAVTGCDVRLQDWLDENGEPELFRFELSCNRKSYYMKLRPHLRTFLRVLEPYYEMSVYTNATQEYADIVVAILDENRQLFSDRIVARNSGFRGEASENKAVRRMYENMDKRCIVAFDDRQNIWTDLPLSHVVKAQHYDFFDSHRAELNAYYPPLPTIGSNGCGLPSIDALGRMSDEIGIGGELGLPDENQQQQQGKGDQQLLKSATSGKKPCDWDKHLDCMLKLFLRIHTEFFRDPAKANIGAILSTVQQSVLSGVGIFFTGYRKTYSPGAAVADCEERQAELAQRLGAKVYKRFDEEGVTHVVAGKNNTNNMLACRENTKLSRVHTLWLYCCEAALTRVPESAFEADALCAYYENSPPTSPYRDHWIHLAQKDDAAYEEKGGANSSKTEIATGSDGAPWLSVAHQHHPLPPQDSLPVREFLGTGPYSDGATLTSPYEEIVFIWRPDKQTVRQLYGEDIRGAAAPPAASTLNTGAPFGSLSPNTGVLLAPVKSGLSGGTANIPSSTAALGPTDVRVPGLFGERAVEASVFTQSLHAANDEGLLETRRVGVLAHGSCPQMQLGVPYE